MRTVEEVRRLRLKEAGTAYGGWSGLAGALKMNDGGSTFSQIVSEKTKKNMGAPLARRIERLMEKPLGWMDTDPAYDDQVWPFGAGIPPAAVAKMPQDLLAEARGALRILLAQAQRVAVDRIEKPMVDLASEGRDIMLRLNALPDVPAKAELYAQFQQMLTEVERELDPISRPESLPTSAPVKR
jgi:hypothetical protein